ncbi:M20/M25/M40 family metallo-hydrolase [Mesorhizobium sp.]|uniref:M20/M25/M40 family metallo-hydrolase n=1 Tax=Mesorhizobium TaxID=68287 RepID=UPI000B869C42|nr:M20/M25/M40 family metallo-hydrolase [Mesorhizobium sp. M5C.F.Ca.IN.020.32.2.1]RWI50734.1 MAG: M20/M25/M40 family metallo-hydrolase [Mesorhizobium sp.]RWP12750.1 MAG: M20/M25/M40 family metallo-hydrolase [Mesorhizobium sp.]TIV01384.1 MAG: M20/M25/M40 family metallo-hydrolase [Mesorhizobium sp.]TJV30359.1 MAG: M20/M25/M40 family metallo-hydrolase [Mesorhizobium sp.]
MRPRPGRHERLVVRSLLPVLEDPVPPSAEGTKIAAVAVRHVRKSQECAGPLGFRMARMQASFRWQKFPSLFLGGSTDQAHTANEYVEIDQLAKAVEIYQKIMLSY